MAVTVASDISQRTQGYAATKFLRHVEPTLVLGHFGQVRPIPLNKGNTIKFRRLVPYPALTAPLQEGVTPSVSATQVEDVETTLTQWGDVHGITDVIEDTHEDGNILLDEMMEESGRQAGATFEQQLFNVVKGGTSVYYANGASRSAVNTAVSLNKVRAVVRTLQGNKAKKITKVIAPTVNIGTKGVEAAYVAVGHTDLEPDIRALQGFKPVVDYGSMKPICAEELGMVENVRFILSPDLEPFESVGGAPGGNVLSANGSNADVYPLIFFGEDAFGITPLKNQKVGQGNNMVVTPTVINPGTATKDDPLGQRGYVGWKAWWAAVRLNETWMVRLEVAASTL